MATTFDYSVIRVEPDARRGERVNIGLVILKDGKLDVRLADTRKASAISVNDWETYIRQFSAFLKEEFRKLESLKELTEVVDVFERQIRLTNTGWFEAFGKKEYEAQVDNILSALVKRPLPPKAPRSKSVATKIADTFRYAKILASKGEGIESGHVVRNYVVDESAGLTADFAMRNGCLHLAEIVDLANTQTHIGTTAEAAITLDKARKTFEGAKGYGVYSASESSLPEVREHLAILGDYSDAIFNWASSDDRRRFTKIFYDAYNSGRPLN